MLRDAKITVHGAAVIARCQSSRFSNSTPAALTPAGALLLVEPLQSLRRLALRDCGLKPLTVEQCAALRASPLLDLSENELSAEAALALAQPGGVGLRELRVAESDAADDLAMAAMAQTSLEVLGLASTRVTSEGVQLIALGLGSTLLTLDSLLQARRGLNLAGSPVSDRAQGARPRLLHFELQRCDRGGLGANAHGARPERMPSATRGPNRPV